MSAGPDETTRAGCVRNRNRRRASYAMRHAETSGAKHLALPRLFGGLKRNVKSAKTGFEARLRKYSQRATCTSPSPCYILPTHSQFATTRRTQDRSQKSAPAIPTQQTALPDPLFLRPPLARPVSQTLIDHYEV